jgi:hypothetical protein
MRRVEIENSVSGVRIGLDVFIFNIASILSIVNENKLIMLNCG